MKILSRFIAIFLLTGTLIYVSCKKEHSCENCGVNPPGNTNKPPIANAGPDQTIFLPMDSITLDGSASRDPDGSISSFQWTRISGPASFTVNNAAAARTVVKNLTAGAYQFELKVTDNVGLSAKDTMMVIVNDPAQPNRPPVANAGPDQTITLPTNTANPDGSGSTDPDNNITSYLWTKISGPSSYNISNINAVQTQITNLVQGNYQFELKVTDAGGLFSKDTLLVVVNPDQPPPPTTCDPGNRSLIAAQLIPIGTISIARSGMAVTSAGNKIFFAGGDGGSSSRVDIYDVTTNTGTTAELSQARSSMGAVAYGNKIFFAGGIGNTGLTSRIDIYDMTTNLWSIKELSVPRRPSAATAGDKVVFAGGVDISLNEYGIDGADIYNASTNTWASTNQGGGRQIGAVTSVGNKIYFAGGYAATGVYDQIDIYDAVLNTWSGSTLSQYKAGMAGIGVNNKIYWAGGDIYNNIGGGQTVEIRDVSTQITSFACLFQPNYGSNYGDNAAFDAVVKNNKIVFFTGQGAIKNKFDIYDVTTNTWSIGVLSVNIEGASIVSVNNTIYVAGGYVNGVLSNQVWKLEF